MVDIREVSNLSLAFVGDGVYSLLIREYLVKNKRYPVNILHKTTIKYVSARGQFAAINLIMDMLTEEEKAVFKRGKNSSKATVAKNASAEEYRASTGFECVIGYLKLLDKDVRINELVGYIIENLDIEKIA